MSTLAQQASAVEAAARLVAGSAQKPSASEKAYLVERLKEAAVTLRNVEYRESRA